VFSHAALHAGAFVFVRLVNWFTGPSVLTSVVLTRGLKRVRYMNKTRFVLCFARTRVAPLKLELAYQHSAGGKNCALLTLYVYRKGIKIVPILSPH
jgi:hypothetical protein